MAKQKKRSEKMTALIILIIIFLFILWSKGYIGQRSQQAGCTNICASSYNQMPYPDCSCYSPEVTSSDTDGDGIPDSIDTDDDNDGFPDSVEEDYGTDPTDPTDYPGGNGEAPVPTTSYTCGQEGDNYCTGTCPPSHPECASLEFPTYAACVCIDGTDVHDDWKPGESMHNPGEAIDNGEEAGIEGTCYDSDGGIDLYTAGYVDISGGLYYGRHYDYCDGTTIYEQTCNPETPGVPWVRQLTCSNVCELGKCVDPPLGCINEVIGQSQTGTTFTFNTGSTMLSITSGGGTAQWDYSLTVGSSGNIESTSCTTTTCCFESQTYSATSTSFGNWNENQNFCVRKGNDYVLITNHFVPWVAVPWPMTIGYDYAYCE